MMEDPPNLDAVAKRPALARQRQSLILERVREQGAVRVADLVRELGVTDMTVRRDLETLADRGLIVKVHGGAASVEASPLFEPGFSAKSALKQEEKALIAGAAASLVAPGTAIAISAGTTTFALAGRLLDVPGLTVLTNSVPVADTLYRNGRPDQTIILTGGVRTPSDALVGPFAVEVIRSLHVDIVFMGTHGMYSRSGFTTPNILESDTNKALIESGRRLIVVADSSKWGVIGISSVARLEDAETVVTDSGLDPVARQQLAAAVGRLLLVDVATGEIRVAEGEGGDGRRFDGRMPDGRS
jgi:DeoR/GlpR family transcriptional regulator of sugar metabolism